jgi:hypothetical protein
MLRATRSLAVTEIDIVPALRWCNLIKTKSFAVQIIGISRFASWKATMHRLTLWPSPRLRDRPAFWTNVANERRGFNRTAKTGCGLQDNQA